MGGFTQGLDCRLLNEQNIKAINALKLKEIHFAWDYMKESEAVLRGLRLYADKAASCMGNLGRCTA